MKAQFAPADVTSVSVSSPFKRANAAKIIVPENNPGNRDRGQIVQKIPPSPFPNNFSFTLMKTFIKKGKEKFIQT